MLVGLLNACTSVPVHHREESKPSAETVVVKPGDTLYGIAFRHGVDYRELAKLNGIGPDWRIEIGQRLTLPSGRAGAAKPDSSKSQPGSTAGGERSPASADRALAVRIEAPPRFEWPASAQNPQLLTKPGGGLGVTIDGVSGQTVNAAAAGKVVYAGNGLMRSYGALIIIKHSENWLTAYGYNQKILVREGDDVGARQPIALMGLNGQGLPQVYFEIRKVGHPVNPFELLPR